jgi:hypothetical protein
MSPLRAALALPIALSLACSSPPTPSQHDKAEPAQPKSDPPKPDEIAKPKRKGKTLKIDPPAELQAKDIPPAPSLASVTLVPATTGTLPLPEGVGVVLPHVALQLEQGLLIAGQAFVDYDPQIRATAIWQYQGFVPITGEPRSSKGESGSVRAGVLDGKGGAVLVGSLGVGLSARAWATRIAADGSSAGELAIESPIDSDLLAILAGGPAEELAVLGGFAGASAWLVAIDDAGTKRWQPRIEADGYAQIRALARIDEQALLAVGTLAQKDGSAWSARIGAEGSTIEHAVIEQLDAKVGTPIDANRSIVALADRGESGLIGLGLAKRGLVQDHDQVFAVGFDRSGKVTWGRAIDPVRAKQVRGAIGWQGAALFVLEVPAGEATALALLRITGPSDADVRVEQIAGSEGKRSAGFVHGADPPQLWIADTKAKLDWQRLEVSP